MAKELKEILFKQLDQTVGHLDSCVLIDYCGINSEQTHELRSLLRKSRVGMSVVQNRIARRVFSERGAPAAFQDLLRGPTAILYGEDGALSASKTVVGWRKKNKELAAIKGGLFEGEMISTEEVERLASLPDIDTLRSRLLGVFMAPLTHLVSVTDTLVRHFPSAAKAHRESLEKGDA
jgi:large subunit ribosomal protein L10